MVARLMLPRDLSAPMPLSKGGSLARSAPQQHGFTKGNLAQALSHIVSKQDSLGTQLHVSEYVELGHAH